MSLKNVLKLMNRNKEKIAACCLIFVLSMFTGIAEGASNPVQMKDEGSVVVVDDITNDSSEELQDDVEANTEDVTVEEKDADEELKNEPEKVPEKEVDSKSSEEKEATVVPENPKKTEETKKNESSKDNNKKENTTNNKNNSNKTDSNKNNTANTGKTEHTHNWVPVYKEVDNGHWEKVLVRDAWVEEVPVYESKKVRICRGCGKDISDLILNDEQAAIEHARNHMNNGENSGWYSDIQEVQTGVDLISHEAEYKDVWVPKMEKKLVGNKCSCGASKSN